MQEFSISLQTMGDLQEQALDSVRTTLVKLLPGASEDIAWGMPSLRIGPDLVVSYSGFAHHNSLFPGPETAGIIAAEFPDVVTTKGTVHFDKHKAPSTKLLKRIVTLRVQQINDSYPRKNGTMRHYFANGFTESVGKMRNDQMHGSWQWFRKDGTLKRTGAFKNGVQVGEWITYDAAGQPYRTSSFTR